MHPIDFTLQTERFFLRELTIKDAPSFFLLNEDPEVLRYTGELPFPSLEIAVDFLKNYKPYQTYGMGRWAVIRKTDSAFLGWCGLKYDPILKETDIGFRFFKKYWNQGYATEAAKKCLVYGFSEKKLPFIVGRAMAANQASVRVLEKLGMEYWRPFDFLILRGSRA